MKLNRGQWSWRPYTAADTREETVSRVRLWGFIGAIVLAASAFCFAFSAFVAAGLFALASAATLLAAKNVVHPALRQTERIFYGVIAATEGVVGIGLIVHGLRA